MDLPHLITSIIFQKKREKTKPNTNLIPEVFSSETQLTFIDTSNENFCGWRPSDAFVLHERTFIAKNINEKDFLHAAAFICFF